MKLYHGTNIDFDAIDLQKSHKNKDFGQGFYLTADRDQAEQMAANKTALLGGSAQILEFECPENILDVKNLKVKVFSGYSKEWAEFILLNRNKSSEKRQHDYDVVYGPIADDKVGLQIKFYQQNFISLDVLMDRLKFHHVTFQYYFGTERALEFLKRVHE